MIYDKVKRNVMIWEINFCLKLLMAVYCVNVENKIFVTLVLGYLDFYILLITLEHISQVLHASNLRINVG